MVCDVNGFSFPKSSDTDEFYTNAAKSIADALYAKLDDRNVLSMLPECSKTYQRQCSKSTCASGHEDGDHHSSPRFSSDGGSGSVDLPDANL